MERDMEPAEIIEAAAILITENKILEASEIVKHEYPFEEYLKPVRNERASKGSAQIFEEADQRKYTQKQALQLFKSEGFIDRYSGLKLVCPSALYAISTVIPEAFPFEGKRSVSHQAFWDLFPSLDHLVPVSGGGKDVEDNWITTSMTMNIKKSNIPFDELGWLVHPKGEFEQWDGLVDWYMQWSSWNSRADEIRLNKGWHSAMLSLFPKPGLQAA